MTDYPSRRSTLGLLGAAFASPARSSAQGASPIGHGAVEARINVRDFGAIADDRTDNAPAFEAAIAAGIATGRPIFVPAATRAYAVSRSLSPSTGIIGEGRGSVIRALSADGFRGGRPIVRIGWNRAESPMLCTVPVTGIKIMGAGVRPIARGSNAKAIQFEGVGLLFDETAAFIHLFDVTVQSCFKGIVHRSVNGHLGGTNVNCGNNWYNLYWECNSGDYRYVDCVFTGAQFATYGCHGSRRSEEDFGGIVGLTTIGCHGGFSPFLFYQEDGNGSTGLVGWTSISSSAEQVGNQVVRLGQTPTGTRRVSSGWFLVASGHSWTVPGTPEYQAYTIVNEHDVPVQRYAVDLDLVQGASIEVHGVGWVAGKSGKHTRIADLQAWLADDNGVGAYEITGGGAERLTYMRAPRYRQPRAIELRDVIGGTRRRIAQFAIPASYNNTPGGELAWTFAYTARVAQPAAIRLIVEVEGTGIAAQVLTPQYLIGGIGNLSGRADIGIGRPGSDGRHGLAVFIEVPDNIELKQLTGSLAFVVAQDTGVVL